MQYHFEILSKSRDLTLNLVKNLSITQLNKIPTGFKNNIAWNIAHLVVTQQLLCYKLSGVNCLVSEEMIKKYQKGAQPQGDITPAEFETIQQQFIALPKQLEDDYKNGVFDNYHEYHTSVGIALKNVEDAIAFNNYHEGIHLGVILQLLKFVKSE